MALQTGPTHTAFSNGHSDTAGDTHIGVHKQLYHSLGDVAEEIAISEFG